MMIITNISATYCGLPSVILPLCVLYCSVIVLYILHSVILHYIILVPSVILPNMHMRIYLPVYVYINIGTYTVYI